MNPLIKNVLVVVFLSGCLAATFEIEDEQYGEAFYGEIEPQTHYRIRRDLEDAYYNQQNQFELELEEPQHRVRRQLFGGAGRTPAGGRTQTVGYQAGPAWGQISQSHNNRGFGTPITYSAGAGHLTPAGHGISGGLHVQPGIGAQGNLRGQVGINKNDHHVNAWAEHTKNFDKNIKPVGPGQNSVGINYVNQRNGASAFVSGSHTPGTPKTGQVGGSIPLFTHGNTRIDANAQTNFGQGRKPDHNVGVSLNHQF